MRSKQIMGGRPNLESGSWSKTSQLTSSRMLVVKGDKGSGVADLRSNRERGRGSGGGFQVLIIKDLQFGPGMVTSQTSESL